MSRKTIQKQTKEQYADTRKKESKLDRRLHPTNPDIEKIIRYRRNGEIYTDVPELNAALFDQDDRPTSTLNLNYQTLVKGREGVWDAVKRQLGKAEWTLSAIQKQIKVFESLDNGRKKAFCGFALYFLRKEYEKIRKRPQ